jgi:hypothetical protein
MPVHPRHHLRPAGGPGRRFSLVEQRLGCRMTIEPDEADRLADQRIAALGLRSGK